MRIRASALLLASAGLLTAGCNTAGLSAGLSGATTTTTPAPPAVADASQVNMCTVLTSTELAGLGVRPDTRQLVSKPGVIGCRWLTKSYTLSLTRDDGTLAGFQTHRQDPKFIAFTDNTVNGRAGAHFGVDPAGSQCAQLMNGGPVSLSVSVAVPPDMNPRPVEPCAEALRIAQMIEPKLP
ncbi:MAG TPA: DUF3558 family protein [Pseudonocardiaceae bacterium]|nr:DUF3558 family protein [Pseudonocardiaceae bacterium]